MPFEQIVCLLGDRPDRRGRRRAPAPRIPPAEGMAGLWASIQNLIKTVQAPIKNAIGWVVQKAVAVGKKLWSMTKGAMKKDY